MRFETFKKELLKDPEFAKEYSKRDLKLDIAAMVMRARIKKKVTQKKLAKLMGTKQPSIARIENASSLPSLKFLEKMAKALGTELIPPKFAFLEEESSPTETFKFISSTTYLDLDNSPEINQMSAEKPNSKTAKTIELNPA